MTQENFLTAFIEGVQITAERLIKISLFDKTVLGTIKSLDKDNNKLYYLSTYGIPNFSAKALENDNTSYRIGDEVYVNLPNGDYSNENRYIVGKITKDLPPTEIRLVDNILVNGYKNITFTSSKPKYLNKAKYLTLIVEFNCYIKTDIKDGLGIKEQIFPLKLNAEKRFDSKMVEEKYLWSTNNMYGNIFNADFPSILRIILEGLEDYSNLLLEWEPDFLSGREVDIIGLNSKVVGTGKIIIKNLKYYFGYDIKKIENNSIYNTSILLSEEGIKFFYKRNKIWYLFLSLSALNKENKDYKWTVAWYEYNLLLSEYNATNSPVPQYWELLSSKPKSYFNKLVLLKLENQASYSYNTKSVFDFLMKEKEE